MYVRTYIVMFRRKQIYLFLNFNILEKYKRLADYAFQVPGLKQTVFAYKYLTFQSVEQSTPRC